jgi:gas vesicle protein
MEIQNQTEDKKIINSSLYFGKTHEVFDISILKRLLREDKIIESKIYILTYFAKSSNGKQIFFYEPEDEKYFNISTVESLSGPIYKCLDKLEADTIKKWFNKDIDLTYKINADPRAPMFYKDKITKQNYINLSNGFLHKHYKPFDSYSIKVKNGVHYILKHIKNTWNSGNEEAYTYCINWLSLALTGHKMPTALFLQSGEGTGKSIIVLFLINKVIGEALGLSTSRCSQLLRFNSQILGKILLCLEELPSSSKTEWHSVSDYLKDLITGNKVDIERKFQDAVQVINLISLIIITNNESTIKFGKDIRRYMMCDISHDYVGNTKHFNDLSRYCEDDLVGEAFYMYLIENANNVKNSFKPEQIPLTSNKLAMKEMNSTKFIKFVKDVYLKRKVGIQKQKLSNLKNLYIQHTGTDITTQQFRKIMESDIPIIKLTYDTKNGHKIEDTTYDVLLNFFKQKGFWNPKYDEFEVLNKDNIDTQDNDTYEDLKEKIKKLKEEHSRLKEEREKLEKELEELQKNYKPSKPSKPSNDKLVMNLTESRGKLICNLLEL